MTRLQFYCYNYNFVATTFKKVDYEDTRELSQNFDLCVVACSLVMSLNSYGFHVMSLYITKYSSTVSHVATGK